MKPIIEYQDYHAFLSDYYEERKRTELNPKSWTV